MKRSGLVLLLALACSISSTVMAAQKPSLDQTSTDPELIRPHYVEVEPGRRMHFVCVGSGSPTIVFEQGGEGWIVNWRKVQTRASRISRTCFYDRAGFGLSDPPKGDITELAVTNDLESLLKSQGIKEPVVLVAHSIGGFYATLFADRFPEQVAGMVLIEPGFDGQFGPKDPDQRRREIEAMRAGGKGLDRCADLARKVAIGQKDPQGCFGLPDGLTRDEAGYVTQMFVRPEWYEAEANQSDHYFPAGPADDSESWVQERQVRRKFGEMPLVVLTAQSAPREAVQDDKAYEEASNRWKEGHRALARRSSRGSWLEVPSSEHFIQLDQPQAVLDAITGVVTDVRRRRN